MQPTPLSESLRGRSVYSDNAKHSALVEHILRVDNDAWQRAVSSYRRILQGDDVESRLRRCKNQGKTLRPTPRNLSSKTGLRSVQSVYTSA